MVRSFAMTFSAVTPRLYMPLAGVMGFDLISAYPTIAWLCWVPNASLAELYVGKGGASPVVATIARSSPQLFQSRRMRIHGRPGVDAQGRPVGAG